MCVVATCGHLILYLAMPIYGYSHVSFSKHSVLPMDFVLQNQVDIEIQNKEIPHKPSVT